MERDQVIFTIDGCISGVKERKNSCELDFSISNKMTAAVAELRLKEKTELVF